MKHRVEGHNNLYKDDDPHSRVIHNRESTDRSRYRIAKQQALANMEAREELSRVKVEFNDLKEELAELSSVKEELSELKDLINQLLK